VRRDGKWVFGAIEQGENKFDPIHVVMFVVADQTAETLLALITKHIQPGTTIYTDCRALYSTVQAEGYQHQTEFMAEDGTCINTIEGCWKHSKRLVGGGKNPKQIKEIKKIGSFFVNIKEFLKKEEG
jgi:transposase-like protein